MLPSSESQSICEKVRIREIDLRGDERSFVRDPFAGHVKACTLRECQLAIARFQLECPLAVATDLVASKQSVPLSNSAISRDPFLHGALNCGNVRRQIGARLTQCSGYP